MTFIFIMGTGAELSRGGGGMSNIPFLNMSRKQDKDEPETGK